MDSNTNLKEIIVQEKLLSQKTVQILLTEGMEIAKIMNSFFSNIIKNSNFPPVNLITSTF